MKKLFSFLLIVAFLLLVNGIAQATVVDFVADGYRGTPLPSITEYASQDGFKTVTSVAGQKVSYGTDYFNGWKLNQIDSIQFTYKNGVVLSPYTNLTITDGSGAYGVISSQGGYWSDVDDNTSGANPYYQATRTFYFAGKNGNSDNNYNFRFYEGVNTALSGGVKWTDISNWYLLGIGETRPLSAGEIALGSPRATLTTGLNIIWGDSAANYIGSKDVWNVSVKSIDGTIYQAGSVPEPTTIVLFGLGILGFSGVSRRKQA